MSLFTFENDYFIDVLSSKTHMVTEAREAQEALPINILVAEDNEFNQKLITHALEKLGYSIDLVENGVDAVSAAKAKQYQLVFMDVMMPVMDGYEAAKIISADHAGKGKPIIIAITANAFSGDRERALEAGMEDYITKPFMLQELQEKIDKWKSQMPEKL